MEGTSQVVTGNGARNATKPNSCGSTALSSVPKLDGTLVNGSWKAGLTRRPIESLGVSQAQAILKGNWQQRRRRHSAIQVHISTAKSSSFGNLKCLMTGQICINKAINNVESITVYALFLPVGYPRTVTGLRENK